MDQNHPQSKWQTTITGNDLCQQGEEFTSYKSVLQLEDNLKSFFILVRLNKSGLKKIMSCLSQHIALMRMHPSGVTESQSREVIASQSVPGWSAFNAMLYSELPEISMVSYCPLIDGFSTEFSTIYTVLKHAQAISNTMGQEDTVIIFDLAIYVKAKQIQWRFANEFSDVVIRMGTFHIALNFLAIIGKKYQN